MTSVLLSMALVASRRVGHISKVRTSAGGWISVDRAIGLAAAPLLHLCLVRCLVLVSSSTAAFEATGLVALAQDLDPW